MIRRDTWIVFLAGPVTWFVHFMVVYLLAEAGCTGDGPGLRLFDPPVPAVATLAATAVAAVACLGFAWWGYRCLDDHSHGDSLTFAGCLLSLLGFLAVLFVGVPALVFEC